MGLSSTIPMILNTVSGFVVPRITEQQGIRTGLNLGVIVCCVSVVAAFVQVFMNCSQRNYDMKLKATQREELLEAHAANLVEDDEEEEKEDGNRGREQKQRKGRNENRGRREGRGGERGQGGKCGKGIS